MGMNPTEEWVYARAAALAEPLGLSIWDVEYQKEAGGYVLRVTVDRATGVSIDDCEQMSRRLEELLDKEDPIPNEYCLEVSSAGIGRTLKRPSDFAQFVGHKVDVKTYAPVAGKKEFCAELAGFEDGELRLVLDGEPFVLPMDQVALVRLTVEF